MRAIVATQGGWFDNNTDNITLARVQCGQQEGIVFAICTGNQKDEGCCYASAAAACAFSSGFGAAMLSEADIAPTMRRSMLDAHECVRRISGSPSPKRLNTFGGSRGFSLAGIGASVLAMAVLPARGWIAHVGDCRALLIRAGKLRMLNMQHTMIRNPQLRRQALGSGETLDSLNETVMRVIGLTDEPPDFDLTRVELDRSDRLLLDAYSIYDR